MSKPTLNFDMDGTLAAFYDVPHWLDFLKKEDVFPYQFALPMVSVDETNQVMNQLKDKGFRFHVVSWGSKHSSEDFLVRTTKVKKDWIKKIFPKVFTRVFVTAYGVPKHETAKAAGNYLFDDNAEVGKAWEAAGGIWIDVTKENILDVLKGLTA